MDEFFSNINVNILTDIIRRKIENSTLSKYFSINEEYRSRFLNLDKSNSLLFEFPTPKRRFPKLYASEKYRVLFILSLQDEENYHHPLLNELKNLKSVENIDKLVLWSRKNIGIEKIQTLKNFGLYTARCYKPSQR